MPYDVKTMPDRREKKTKTPEQALSSLMRYCSRAERSSGDALRLMRGWGIEDHDALRILERLRREKFIDDRRFAEAYVRDKTGLAGWGPYKVRTGLKAKGIHPDIVAGALSGIDDLRAAENLHFLLEKKAAGLKGTVYERKGKLVRFGLSRGFGYDVVIKISDEIISTDE